MNDSDNMNFAYLTEEDVKTLMNQKKLKTPFVLIEASEDTQVDYYVPKCVQEKSDNQNFHNIEESSDDYQILIQS